MAGARHGTGVRVVHSLASWASRRRPRLQAFLSFAHSVITCPHFSPLGHGSLRVKPVFPLSEATPFLAFFRYWVSALATMRAAPSVRYAWRGMVDAAGVVLPPWSARWT
jgi:hypothetical protein